MGQQQLFVYILVVFIIGVATVVAVDTLKEAYENANFDAVREDIMLSLQDAQQYYLTHRMYGGGGRSFDGIDISRLSLTDKTQSGTYAISGNGNTVVIEGWGNYEGIYIKAEGTMLSDGLFNIKWTHGTED